MRGGEGERGGRERRGGKRGERGETGNRRGGGVILCTKTMYTCTYMYLQNSGSILP